MIILVEKPVDVANYVDLHNLLANMKGGSEGKPAVAMLQWAALGAMKPKEKLYVVAHGVEDGSAVGGLAPDVLAKKLLAAGLPGHIASVKLLACNSGITTGPLDPYAKRFADELKKHSRGAVNPPVVGFTYYAAVNQYGQSRALDPEAVKKHMTEYVEINTRWKADVTRWEQQAKALPCATQEQLIASARTIAEESKAFIAEMYKLNAKITKSKADSKYRVIGD